MAVRDLGQRYRTMSVPIVHRVLWIVFNLTPKRIISKWCGTQRDLDTPWFETLRKLPDPFVINSPSPQTAAQKLELILSVSSVSTNIRIIFFLSFLSYAAVVRDKSFSGRPRLSDLPRHQGEPETWALLTLCTCLSLMCESRTGVAALWDCDKVKSGSCFH